MRFVWQEQSVSRGDAGFTLIELLVTSGILVILSTATLISLNFSATQRELDQATEEFRLALTDAQSLALAPPVEKSLGNGGYRLHFLSDPSQPSRVVAYEIREIGSLPGAVPVVISSALVREGRFPPKTALQLVGGGVIPDFVFSIPDQGDITEPNPSDGLIRLEVLTKRGDLAKRLTVSTETGQVDSLPE